MKLPDDVFNQEILQYLIFDNIVKLDQSSNSMNTYMDRLRDGWMDRYRDMLCEETVGEMIGMTDGQMD